MDTQVIGFLTANPNSNKAAITEATGMKGLPLYTALKALLKEGRITSTGEGSETTYSLDENFVEALAGEDKMDATRNPEPIGPIVEGEKKEDEPQTNTEEPKVKEATSRDNSKYKFNGEEYGKGPLVRAVVAKYVEDHPDTTHKQLKEIFPDTLMKRFGVFANETEAKKLSGNKPRYFLKPEQMIKIKGQKEPIAICNQWTAALIEPFIKVAKELGYKIK